MAEHGSLTVKVEKENGSVTYLGAVSVTLVPMDELLHRQIEVEMESGERRYIVHGLVWIMNSAAKTVDRIDLRTAIDIDSLGVLSEKEAA